MWCRHQWNGSSVSRLRQVCDRLKKRDFCCLFLCVCVVHWPSVRSWFKRCLLLRVKLGERWNVLSWSLEYPAETWRWVGFFLSLPPRAHKPNDACESAEFKVGKQPWLCLAGIKGGYCFQIREKHSCWFSVTLTAVLFGGFANLNNCLETDFLCSSVVSLLIIVSVILTVLPSIWGGKFCPIFLSFWLCGRNELSSVVSCCLVTLSWI